MGLPPEEAWGIFTKLQMEKGKRFRLGSSAQLMAWLRPEYRRDVHDIDIVTGRFGYARRYRVRIGGQIVDVDVITGGISIHCTQA